MVHKTYLGGPGLTLMKARDLVSKCPIPENRKVLKIAKKQWKNRIKKEYFQLDLFFNFKLP